MRSRKGQFEPGQAYNKLPVGTVTVRTRHSRGGEQRAYIKINEPNIWILRARYVWQQHHGEIPPGMAIHHRDGDKLNDSIENLELVSKAEHIDKHRLEYQERSVTAWAAKRREMRWSTKSKTKRTGRPADWTEEQMAQAIASASATDRTESIAEIARQYKVGRAALYKRLGRT